MLCTDYLPPSGGGVEVVVEELATRLVRAGLRVIVFTLQEEIESDITDYEMIEVYQSKSVDLTDLVGLQTRVSPRAVFDFKSVINQYRPDVVHFHNRFFFTSLVGACWKAARMVNIPVITTLHLGSLDGFDGVSAVIANGYQQTIGRMILQKSDGVIAVSEAVADQATQLGVDAERIDIVPNAVDIEKYYPNTTSRSEKRILFVGRLIRNKGPHDFLKAVPRVLDRHPDATFQIIGTGPMRAELEERAATGGSAGSVTFSGYVEDISEAYRNADVFCRPSHSEGLPLTLLEAMASGLPPVVTPVAGVPEVVQDGETGVLVSQHDPADVARALSWLLDSPRRIRLMGRTAREYVVANHSWESRTDKVMHVYEKAARNT